MEMRMSQIGQASIVRMDYPHAMLPIADMQDKLLPTVPNAIPAFEMVVAGVFRSAIAGGLSPGCDDDCSDPSNIGHHALGAGTRGRPGGCAEVRGSDLLERAHPRRRYRQPDCLSGQGRRG